MIHIAGINKLLAVNLAVNNKVIFFANEAPQYRNALIASFYTFLI